jgi:glycosyltransferase involved in cell wall biosynthesis
MQARVERSICNHADVGIWFTDQALASAKRRNPQLGERGKMMIPGVDKPDVSLKPYQRSGHFVIGHFGSLSATRNLRSVVRALELLVESAPQARNQIQLHLYGGPLDSVSTPAIASSPVKDCVKHFGRIEADPLTGQSGREQILQRMRNADVLLLLHGEEPICAEYIPSKLYEYFWTERPIVALTYNNPQMQKMIEDAGCQAINTYEQPAPDVALQLSVALKSLWEQWHAGDLRHALPSQTYSTAQSCSRLLGWSAAVRKPS